MTTNRESGFTMVEVAMAAAMLMLLMSAFYKASQTFTSSIRATEKAAAASDRLDIGTHVVEQVMRSAVATSFKSKVTAADVAQAVTTNMTPLPVLGDWAPVPMEAVRSSLQFVCASGVATMNATLTTGPRALQFVMDPSEQPNSQDDNGNGLIDEGRLVYDTGREQVTVLPGVEACHMVLDGRVVRIKLALAQRDKAGHVHRASLTRSIFIRNSGG